MEFIDTHAHIDGQEFASDIDEVISRAKHAGATKIFVPAISLKTLDGVIDMAVRYPDFAMPMIGLHPEEVDAEFQQQLSVMKNLLTENINRPAAEYRFIAIGEVGLDFYWSREYENEQLRAFEEQVKWSVETQFPLMIHCRKAQNELVKILRLYEKELPGGVFHCFTGNLIEATELLRFDNFALGIGGVITFKKSNLPEVVAELPLERIVVETDSPYMAPVPHRGKRNESSFVVEIINKIAEAKNVSPDLIAKQTSINASRIFGLNEI